MVGFLKQDIGADTRFLESAVVFAGGGGNVHIDPADGSVLEFFRVDGTDAVQHVVNGAVFVVFAEFQQQALVTQFFKRAHFLADLFLRELDAGDAVGAAEPAVFAVVHAVVGKIERREHHDALAVNAFLDLLGQMEDAIQRGRIFHIQKHRGLAVGEAPAFCSPGEDAFDVGRIGGEACRFFNAGTYFGVVNELVGVTGFGIIHAGAP